MVEFHGSNKKLIYNYHAVVVFMMAHEQRTASVGMHDDLDINYQDVADSFVCIIQMAGYAVTTTYGLASTLEAVRREPFDLYVVEINLGQPRVSTSEPLQQ